MTRRLFAPALLAAAFFAAPAALAQSGESATVNINALLQPGASQVSVEATDADFGTVNIPNGSVPGAICQYTLLTSAQAVVMSELDENLNSSAVFASGCGGEGSAIGPTFEVSCPTDLDINYTFETVYGSDANVWSVMSIGVGDPLDFFSVSNAPETSTPPSVSFDRQCQNGELDIYIETTQLFIRDGAQPGPADAGAFTLTADF